MEIKMRDTEIHKLIRKNCKEFFKSIVYDSKDYYDWITIYKLADAEEYGPDCVIYMTAYGRLWLVKYSPTKGGHFLDCIDYSDEVYKKFNVADEIITHIMKKNIKNMSPEMEANIKEAIEKNIQNAS